MRSEYVAQLELSPRSLGRDKTWPLEFEDMLEISAGPTTSCSCRGARNEARMKCNVTSVVVKHYIEV